MTASIAYNKRTGEALRLTPDGQWEPTRVARNPQTGAVLALDGEQWVSVGATKGPEGGALRSLGLGTRNVMEGLGALPSLVSNAFVGNRGNMGANLANAIGLPQAESRGERIVGRGISEVAATLPMLGAGMAMRGAEMAAPLTRRVGEALAGQIPAQIAGAAGSGLAAQTAQEEGAGPVGEAVAGLAGGIGGAASMGLAQTAGRTLAAAGQPFTQSGRERMAADALLTASADPDNLAARLRQGVADDGTRRIPSAPVTTAQAARDPGLAVLEQGARNDVMRAPGQGGTPAGIAIRDMEARRNALRGGELQSLNPVPNSDATGRGAEIRGALRNAETDAKAYVRRLYGDIERSGPAQVDSAPIAMRVAESVRRQPGQAPLPGDIVGTLDDLANQTAPQPVRFFQNIRSRLGEVGGKAIASGDEQTQRLVNRAREALSEGLDDAIANSQGLTQQQRDAWTMANSARRQMGDTFGRTGQGGDVVGRVLRRDAFGAPMVADSNVARQTLSSPENVSQALRAAGMNAREVRKQLQGQFIEELTRAVRSGGATLDVQGNAVSNLSGDAFIKMMESRDGVARMLFDASQYQRLQRIGRDFAETMSTTGAAKARGSDTAQNITVGNLIARATNGLIDPGNPLAQTVAGLGPILKTIYSAPEAATREIISQAVADPQFALTLVSRATPRNIQRAADYLNQTMPDRLSRAAADFATRQGARTGNALAVQATQEP